MNADERSIFWNKLCSFNGKDIFSESQELTQVIKLPQFIYRYRAVNDVSIDALKDNKLYFSNSSYYDDPFDTYLHIDYKKIYQELIRTQGHKESAIKAFAEICKNNGENECEVAQAVERFRKLSNEQVFNLLSSFLKSKIQPLIRNTSMSICFSESGINETMWLKYADQYKGFCLMFSLRAEDESNFLCGKQDKCKKCGIAKYGTLLYPMYYSDEKYDATKYAFNLAYEMFLRQCYPSLSNEEIIKQLDPCLWEKERVTLIKSKCHEYDQEWRAIIPVNMKPPVMQRWIPYGVIIGLRTTDEDRIKILQSAKIAGVKHIFQTIIDDNGALDAIEIKEESVNA